jgi:hypothetical protein
LSGAAQGAAGGFLIAGPIGAAVGGAIGLGEMIAGVESPRRQAKRLAKQDYGISINNGMADQIVGIADSKYGHQLSLAITSPEVRQMLGLYAAGTGQKNSAISSMTPHGAGLTEAGGKLYQSAVSIYGQNYGYQSNLPVYGGASGGTLPNPGGSPQISLNISGADAASFMTGQYVTPQFVGQQYSAALTSSQGRVNNSLMLNEPGTIIG